MRLKSRLHLLRHRAGDPEHNSASAFRKLAVVWTVESLIPVQIGSLPPADFPYSPKV
jgi:hypothetical protein